MRHRTSIWKIYSWEAFSCSLNFSFRGLNLLKSESFSWHYFSRIDEEKGFRLFCFPTPFTSDRSRFDYFKSFLWNFQHHAPGLWWHRQRLTRPPNKLTNSHLTGGKGMAKSNDKNSFFRFLVFQTFSLKNVKLCDFQMRKKNFFRHPTKKRSQILDLIKTRRKEAPENARVFN